jgi:hypothetical protein
MRPDEEEALGVSRRIAPCLWFDSQAEAAAKCYTGIFRNSKITQVSHYGEAGAALNGGPVFKFNEAISFQIDCETQAEGDHFWERLSEGGDPTAQQCGWLKDYPPFNLGSSRSRSPSPSMLKPKTASESATAGQMASHGAVYMWSRPASESMPPHVG